MITITIQGTGWRVNKSCCLEAWNNPHGESTILHLELIIKDDLFNHYCLKEQSCFLIRIKVLSVVLILQFLVLIANQMNVKIKKGSIKRCFPGSRNKLASELKT